MRMTAEQRRSVIIAAAVRVASSDHLSNVNHSTVAKRCVVPTTSHTVRRYFGQRMMLWKAVVEADPSFIDQAKELGVKC